MPELPSGINLAICRDALFDHGGNWFRCPDGYFWYWTPAPEMGAPPFELDTEVLQHAQHAPVPRSREEVKRFIRVYELAEDGMYRWRGEMLSLFPRYTDLDERDLAAWNMWLEDDKVGRFLDETIEECRRLSDVGRRAHGYAVFEKADQAADEEGWTRAQLRVPPKPN